jgi:hypothetical protein
MLLSFPLQFPLGFATKPVTNVGYFSKTCSLGVVTSHLLGISHRTLLASGCSEYPRHTRYCWVTPICLLMMLISNSCYFRPTPAIFVRLLLFSSDSCYFRPTPAIFVRLLLFSSDSLSFLLRMLRTASPCLCARF